MGSKLKYIYDGGAASTKSSNCLLQSCSNSNMTIATRMMAEEGIAAAQYSLYNLHDYKLSAKQLMAVSQWRAMHAVVRMARAYQPPIYILLCTSCLREAAGLALADSTC
eukprot:scaffold201035_cov16-Prasinocladus_malaysianus.AAC.1